MFGHVELAHGERLRTHPGALQATTPPSLSWAPPHCWLPPDKAATRLAGQTRRRPGRRTRGGRGGRTAQPPSPARTDAYLAFLKEDQAFEAYNATLKVKFTIEHRMGQVLAATVKHGGHNKKQGITVIPCSGRLPEGISKLQSSRLQAFAELPLAEILEQVDRATANGKESGSAVYF
jgi:hypothetical protein